VGASERRIHHEETKSTKKDGKKKDREREGEKIDRSRSKYLCVSSSFFVLFVSSW
jgi:hypothetical protein